MSDEIGMSHKIARVLVLSEADNVAVLLGSVALGDRIDVNGTEVEITQPLDMGQKLALSDIAIGQDILKYGLPIGYAAHDIALGDHVHIHNIKSRYTVVEEME